MTDTISQLLTGNFGQQIALVGVKIERASLDQLRSKANELDFYYEQDNWVTQTILRNDLGKYIDVCDITRMKLITVDSFVPSFLKKICNVHDNPASILLKDDAGDKMKHEMEKFKDLMIEVKLQNFFAETFEKVRMHNTIVPYVKYNKSQDKVVLDNNYNVGTCFVVPEKDDSLALLAIAYEQMNDEHEVTWVVWDRGQKEHYRLKTDAGLPNYDYGKGFQGDKSVIGENVNYDMPKYDDKHRLPFVTYQYKNHNNSFWGNGMYFLTDLVRSINILLTIVNDDTIQETIRLLILNFNPSGTEGEKGYIKGGIRHPIFVESGGIGRERDPKAEITEVDLYNDDVLKLIDKLVEMVSSLHNIDSPLKARLIEDLSGIAIRMRNEPLLRNWKNDINILRYPDMELLRTIILVNNYHRKGQTKRIIDPNLIDSIMIDYAEPTIITDEKADYELEQLKWQDGTSSPVQFLMKQNPELSEQEAKDLLAKYKGETELITPKKTPPFTFKKTEVKNDE